MKRCLGVVERFLAGVLALTIGFGQVPPAYALRGTQVNEQRKNAGGLEELSQALSSVHGSGLEEGSQREEGTGYWLDHYVQNGVKKGRITLVSSPFGDAKEGRRLQERIRQLYEAGYKVVVVIPRSPAMTDVDKVLEALPNQRGPGSLTMLWSDRENAGNVSLGPVSESVEGQMVPLSDDQEFLNAFKSKGTEEFAKEAGRIPGETFDGYLREYADRLANVSEAVSKVRSWLPSRKEAKMALQWFVAAFLIGSAWLPVYHNVKEYLGQSKPSHKVISFGDYRALPVTVPQAQVETPSDHLGGTRTGSEFDELGGWLLKRSGPRVSTVLTGEFPRRTDADFRSAVEPEMRVAGEPEEREAKYEVASRHGEPKSLTTPKDFSKTDAEKFDGHMKKNLRPLLPPQGRNAIPQFRMDPKANELDWEGSYNDSPDNPTAEIRVIGQSNMAVPFTGEVGSYWFKGGSVMGVDWDSKGGVKVTKGVWDQARRRWTWKEVADSSDPEAKRLSATVSGTSGVERYLRVWGGSVKLTDGSRVELKGTAWVGQSVREADGRRQRVVTVMPFEEGSAVEVMSPNETERRTVGPQGIVEVSIPERSGKTVLFAAPEYDLVEKRADLKQQVALVRPKPSVQSSAGAGSPPPPPDGKAKAIADGWTVSPPQEAVFYPVKNNGEWQNMIKVNVVSQFPVEVQNRVEIPSVSHTGRFLNLGKTYVLRKGGKVVRAEASLSPSAEPITVSVGGQMHFPGAHMEITVVWGSDGRASLKNPQSLQMDQTLKDIKAVEDWLLISYGAQLAAGGQQVLGKLSGLRIEGYDGTVAVKAHRTLQPGSPVSVELMPLHGDIRLVGVLPDAGSTGTTTYNVRSDADANKLLADVVLKAANVKRDVYPIKEGQIVQVAVKNQTLSVLPYQKSPIQVTQESWLKGFPEKVELPRFEFKGGGTVRVTSVRYDEPTKTLFIGAEVAAWQMVTATGEGTTWLAERGGAEPKVEFLVKVDQAKGVSTVLENPKIVPLPEIVTSTEELGEYLAQFGHPYDSEKGVLIVDGEEMKIEGSVAVGAQKLPSGEVRVTLLPMMNKNEDEAGSISFGQNGKANVWEPGQPLKLTGNKGGKQGAFSRESFDELLPTLQGFEKVGDTKMAVMTVQNGVNNPPVDRQIDPTLGRVSLEGKTVAAGQLETALPVLVPAGLPRDQFPSVQYEQPTRVRYQVLERDPIRQRPVRAVLSVLAPPKGKTTVKIGGHPAQTIASGQEAHILLDERSPTQVQVGSSGILVQTVQNGPNFAVVERGVSGEILSRPAVTPIDPHASVIGDILKEWSTVRGQPERVVNIVHGVDDVLQLMQWTALNNLQPEGIRRDHLSTWIGRESELNQSISRNEAQVKGLQKSQQLEAYREELRILRQLAADLASKAINLPNSSQTTVGPEIRKEINRLVAKAVSTILDVRKKHYLMDPPQLKVLNAIQAQLAAESIQEKHQRQLEHDQAVRELIQARLRALQGNPKGIQFRKFRLQQEINSHLTEMGLPLPEPEESSETPGLVDGLEPFISGVLPGLPPAERKEEDAEALKKQLKLKAHYEAIVGPKGEPGKGLRYQLNQLRVEESQLQSAEGRTAAKAEIIRLGQESNRVAKRTIGPPEVALTWDDYVQQRVQGWPEQQVLALLAEVKAFGLEWAIQKYEESVNDWTTRLGAEHNRRYYLEALLFVYDFQYGVKKRSIEEWAFKTWRDQLVQHQRMYTRLLAKRMEREKLGLRRNTAANPQERDRLQSLYDEALLQEYEIEAKLVEGRLPFLKGWRGQLVEKFTAGPEYQRFLNTVRRLGDQFRLLAGNINWSGLLTKPLINQGIEDADKLVKHLQNMSSIQEPLPTEIAELKNLARQLAVKHRLYQYLIKMGIPLEHPSEFSSASLQGFLHLPATVIAKGYVHSPGDAGKLVPVYFESSYWDAFNLDNYTVSGEPTFETIWNPDTRRDEMKEQIYQLVPKKGGGSARYIAGILPPEGRGLRLALTSASIDPRPLWGGSLPEEKGPDGKPRKDGMAFGVIRRVKPANGAWKKVPAEILPQRLSAEELAEVERRLSTTDDPIPPKPVKILPEGPFLGRSYGAGEQIPYWISPADDGIYHLFRVSPQIGEVKILLETLKTEDRGLAPKYKQPEPKPSKGGLEEKDQILLNRRRFLEGFAAGSLAAALGAGVREYLDRKGNAPLPTAPIPPEGSPADILSASPVRKLFPDLASTQLERDVERFFAGVKQSQSFIASNGVRVPAGVYRSYHPDPANRVHAFFAGYPRFWVYDEALTVYYLLQANRPKEARTVVDALVRIAEQEKNKGFDGLWHFSYGTRYVDPRAPMGAVGWVFKAIYAYTLRTGDTKYLVWANHQLRELVLDSAKGLQVSNKEDPRFGLIQAGYEGNKVAGHVILEHQWNFTDVFRLAYRATERFLRNEEPFLNLLVQRHGLLMSKVKEKLWVDGAPGDAHFWTGMSATGAIYRSEAWDGVGWATWDAYDEEMAWKQIQHLDKRFAVKLDVSQFEDLPPNRAKAGEKVGGLIFFTRDFEDPYVRKSPKFEQMLQPEATFGAIWRLIQFSIRTTDLERREWAVQRATSLYRSMVRLNEIYSDEKRPGLPYATMDIELLFSTMRSIASNANAGIVTNLLKGKDGGDYIGVTPPGRMLVAGKAPLKSGLEEFQAWKHRMKGFVAGALFYGVLYGGYHLTKEKVSAPPEMPIPPQPVPVLQKRADAASLNKQVVSAEVTIKMVQLTQEGLTLALSGVPDGARVSAWAENDLRSEKGVFYAQPRAYQTEPVQGGKVLIRNPYADTDARRFRPGHLYVVILKDMTSFSVFSSRLDGHQDAFNEGTIRTLVADRKFASDNGLVVIKITGPQSAEVLKPGTNSGLEEAIQNAQGQGMSSEEVAGLSRQLQQIAESAGMEEKNLDVAMQAATARQVLQLSLLQTGLEEVQKAVGSGIEIQDQKQQLPLLIFQGGLEEVALAPVAAHFFPVVVLTNMEEEATGLEEMFRQMDIQMPHRILSLQYRTREEAMAQILMQFPPDKYAYQELAGTGLEELKKILARYGLQLQAGLEKSREAVAHYLASRA